MSKRMMEKKKKLLKFKILQVDGEEDTLDMDPAHKRSKHRGRNSPSSSSSFQASSLYICMVATVCHWIIPPIGRLFQPLDYFP